MTIPVMRKTMIWLLQLVLQLQYGYCQRQLKYHAITKKYTKDSANRERQNFAKNKSKSNPKNKDNNATQKVTGNKKISTFKTKNPNVSKTSNLKVI